ncbi:MAG TPA: restriction endonuclease subunit S [Gammaproteobacteria bacterium]|nr:restriction endonuclease subunit S [Gammaproteobacteria bacterium]
MNTIPRLVAVGDVIQTRRRTHKIKKSEYKESGALPVIDQGKDFVAGYIDDPGRAYDGNLPVIVFGDHTCVLKYVNFKFAIGADGTQLIAPRDSNEVDVRYLYYALHTTQVEQFGYQRHFKYLKEAKIPLWPIEIQRKISAILSAYDELIENNTRRIKILEEMAKAIYREWFVKFRFPGHEKVKMIDSPLGLIPEGWEVTKIGKVASVNELSIKKSNEPAKIEYIDIKSVGTGFIEKTTSYSFQEAPGRARRIVRDGDTIWSTVRPNRKSYSLILAPAANLVASTGFAVLTPKEVPFTFLYHVVTTDEYAEYLVNHATGAAYPAVNAKDFSNADIVKPSDEVLALFNNAVESMYRYKHLLDKKNRNLRRTRDVLLPRLVSGELPVDMADNHIVAVG